MRRARRRCLILGGGGFIGSHLANDLKRRRAFVKAVDLKKPDFSESSADEFVIGDLKLFSVCKKILHQNFDEIYQLAAEVGGAGYTFTGDNDAEIMRNSMQINLNIAELLKHSKAKLFFSSSACIYPQRNQKSRRKPDCSEKAAYPADPDSNYGWEKLFSERLYQAFAKNYKLNIRIARFHNIYGPESPYEGGREKAPAAICRKVAKAKNGEAVEVWGDGKQTRSFLYIDDCLKGVRRLMNSNFPGPVNIGSDEMVSINDLARLIIKISGKKLRIKHVPGPQGVRGRNSDNKLAKKKMSWAPQISLYNGMKKTYDWINSELQKNAF